MDDSHAAKLAAVIEPQITTNEEDVKIKLAITEAMDARVQFFNGIQRQISKYSLYPDAWLIFDASM